MATTQYVLFITVGSAFAAAYLSLVHLFSRGPRYRGWRKYLTISVDSCIPIAFFLEMARPEFAARVSAESVVSVGAVVITIIIALNALRLSTGAIAYGTALGAAVVLASTLVLPVSQIGRIWLAPLMLVAGAVTYWISRNVTSLIHAPRRREKLARFLPKDLARLLEDSDLDLTLGGKTTRVTVLVADIRGFTRYCENRSPQEIAEALNEYFTFMSAIIHDHGGMIDKYIGDAVMAVFGAPLPREDHASRAAGRPSFRIGIALNTGEALAGYIGAPDRLDYTVIGDTVNLAARREELNKTYGTSVIMSEETCREIGAGAGARFLGEVPIRGRESPVRIYSLDRPA